MTLSEQTKGVRFLDNVAPNARCPNCAHVGLQLFYESRGIPVHSVLLMDSREEAQAYPTGDLVLGFCKACGFIANLEFDDAVHEYSTKYEETQGFSPRFREFATSLCRRWIERHDLRGKTVLEIGCGKGEFLALLCELGENRGVGMDPAYVPGRLESSAMDRMEFVQDFYTEQDHDRQADFICCRHTLEHIKDTRDFLHMIRSTLEGRDDTVVAFELPDITRILEEGAYWDIYYEHCSYFSPGSLATLFRQARFDVTHLERDYDDQYVLIDARPAATNTEPSLPLEDDLEQLEALVSQFKKTVGAKLDHWRTRFAQWKKAGQRCAIWGSGSKAVAFLCALGLGDEVAGVVDINPHKHGKFLPGSGHEIVAPQALRELAPHVIVVMNPIYLEEIGADLAKMGVESELLPA